MYFLNCMTWRGLLPTGFGASSPAVVWLCAKTRSAPSLLVSFPIALGRKAGPDLKGSLFLMQRAQELVASISSHLLHKCNDKINASCGYSAPCWTNLD